MKNKLNLSCIILTVLIAAAVLCLTSCSRSGEAQTTPVTEAVTEPPADPVFPPESEGPLSGCLFIGDSRTNDLRKAGALPGADTFCSDRMLVYDAISEPIFFDEYNYNLDQILSERAYDKIYVMLGMDEIEYKPEDVAIVYSGLISFIQERQPDAKIIVQANNHFTTKRSHHGDVYNNVRIDALNGKLRELTDGTTVLWLDQNQIFDEEMGGLKKEYSEEDGIHLNAAGNEMWGEWIIAQNENF